MVNSRRLVKRRRKSSQCRSATRAGRPASITARARDVLIARENGSRELERGVHTEVDGTECWEKTGTARVKAIWSDVCKTNGTYRCRFVAKDVRPKEQAL